MSAKRAGSGVETRALEQTLPRHLGWALRAVGGEDMTSDMRAALRQQMVQTFNAVIGKCKEFAPEYGMNIVEAQPGERAVFAVSAAIEQTRLGLEYLVHARGMDVARNVVRRGDIAAFLRLGRGLCMDLQSRADAAAARAVVQLPRGLRNKNREFYVRSSAVWESLASFRPRNNPERADAFQSQDIATMFDYHAAAGRLKSAEETLAFADRIGVTRQVCGDLIEDDAWEDLLLRCVPSGVVENGLPLVQDPLRFGFLEMVVFAQSFAHAHGTRSANAIELPERLLPRFERLFDRHPEDIAHLERACDAVFGADAPTARACLAAYFDDLEERVGYSRSDATDVLERAGLFPNRAVHADYCARHNADMRVATAMNTGRTSEAAPERRVPFLLRMPELQALSDAQLAEVVADHPHAVEWNPLLFDHPTVEDLSGLIRRIFDIGTERARVWVADFLLLLYAFDSRVMAPGALESSEKDPAHIYDRMTACMQRRVMEQTPALPERINRVMTGGIHDYVRTYVGTIVNEHVHDDFAAGSIVMEAERDVLPAVCRLEHWHPAFMNAQPTCHEILKETQSTDIGYTLAYAVRRGWLQTFTDWSECINDLSDRMMADALRQMGEAMPGDHMIRELVGHLIDITLSSVLLKEKHDPESAGKRVARILNLPVGIFIDTEHCALRFMPRWESIGRFMQALAPADRARVYAWIHPRRERLLTGVIPDVCGSEDRILTTFETRRVGFRMSDIPVLEEICAQPNHGLRNLLLPRAAKSAVSVRAALLQGALCADDALAVAMELLRSENKRAMTTAGQVGRDLRSGTLHAALRKVKPLPDVLDRNAPLRDALADALEKQADTLIGEIVVPAEEYTLVPVDVEENTTPPPPPPRRRRRSAS